MIIIDISFILLIITDISFSNAMCYIIISPSSYMVNVAVPNYPYALGSAFVKKKKNKEEEEEEERKKKKERGLALLYQPIIL
jgi:hypothetical protein